jgi:hypothetical protein
LVKVSFLIVLSPPFHRNIIKNIIRPTGKR